MIPPHRCAWIFAMALPACAGAGPSPSPGQQVRAVDEHGQPVAGARVALFASTSAATPLRAAITDQHGLATFPGLGAGRYTIDAALAPRWNLPTNELEGRSAWLDGAVVTVTLHEVQMVGVRLPGARLVWSSHASWYHHEPAREDVVGDPARWPADAVVLHGFRSRNAPADAGAQEMIVEWFGYAPLVERQDWTPASRFRGPRIVERTELTEVPWRELPVVLRDPDGTPLPPATAVAVRRQCVLMRQDDEACHRFYRLDPPPDRPDRIAVPCGDYALRLHQTGRWRDLPLTITDDTERIDGTLPLQLRLLRVRLVGVQGTNWGIRAHSRGQDFGIWLPTPDGVVEIPLQPGTAELQFEHHLDGGGFRRLVLGVVMRDEDVQEVRWDLR